MAKVLQITNVELIAKIEALKGTKTINQFISELIEFQKNNAGAIAKKAQNVRVRKNNYVGKTTYAKVDHTEVFLQILEVAKVVYAGKKIAISFFSNKAKNGICNLHYDVVKSLIQSLNIDLDAIAITKKSKVGI
jgi:hypothetical protein